ncbi:single-stranded DNA-binding protein [Borrelia miyamotoi]|uniref:Single-stranded DNA-binding protein n=1 Tax=Borrelia miyamotoi TaxID=47466 RepID=A0AAQ3AG82_9SPIR|nr:single-stranded DNA-binding protein [Borrelia miyamotoi]AGT26975.1 single-stranded DNA-binding protein [Borrelia miyamotoi LB-2001]AJA58321.1 single-stranded DNA-binding protein [Borrelia miyamotoi]AOW95397.1 single-stranded DNA-binding protein [Borrelia miyamotoi]QTL83277.1 single-stranded DNA-binding protein [Borrelia miyamotoi]WAZ85437.1 single-stranded DNA-binding protein [Borrelia miyamotoi]
MADINSLVLSGRLTRDSELTYTEMGMAILKFGLANNKKVKKNDEWVDYAQFFDCVIFSRRAESLSVFLKKGKQVVVSGSLRYESWQDKNTGDKRSKCSVLVDNIQMFGSSLATQDTTNNIGFESYKKPDSLKEIGCDNDFNEDIPF